MKKILWQRFCDKVNLHTKFSARHFTKKFVSWKICLESGSPRFFDGNSLPNATLMYIKYKKPWQLEEGFWYWNLLVYPTWDDLLQLDQLPVYLKNWKKLYLFYMKKYFIMYFWFRVLIFDPTYIFWSLFICRSCCICWSFMK